MNEQDATPLSADRRAELLDRISRRGATIGESIPERVKVDDETIELESFVWETKRQGVVPPESHEQVQSVRRRLKRERDGRKERLAEETLTVEEGEGFAESVVGIDRAIAALKSLGEPNLGGHKHDRKIQNSERWMAFLDKLR